MNDCPNGEVRDRLPDLLHARLSPAARTDVEAHLATCEACRAELALLRDLRATFAPTPAVDVGKITAAVSARRSPVRRSWTGWRAAAAIAVVVTGGGAVALLNRTPAAPKTVAVIAPAPHVAPVVRDSAHVASRPEALVRPRTGLSPSESGHVSRPGTPIVVDGRELAMAGSLVDLSDRELDALLRDIESLDALPSTDVDASIIAPMSPGARGRGTP